MKKLQSLEELLEKWGKRCPKCRSVRITSGNSVPLNHRCLDCGHKFLDDEAIHVTKVRKS